MPYVYCYVNTCVSVHVFVVVLYCGWQQKIYNKKRFCMRESSAGSRVLWASLLFYFFYIKSFVVVHYHCTLLRGHAAAGAGVSCVHPDHAFIVNYSLLFHLECFFSQKPKKKNIKCYCCCCFVFHLKCSCTWFDGNADYQSAQTLFSLFCVINFNEQSIS